MAEGKLQKAVKRLEIAKDTSSYQKAWFKSLRERVANGEPLGWGTVSVPEELLCAMDLPFVCIQWWTALCAAKQMGPKFYDLLGENGYRNDICSYCSSGYACSLDPEPESGPWGGLPKPSYVISYDHCPSAKKIDELTAEKWGAEIFYMPNSRNPIQVNDWELKWNEWEKLTTKRRLDERTEDLQRLVQFLERVTGRELKKDRLIEALHYSNEQNIWFSKVRDLISGSYPAPCTVSDTIGTIMQTQWHRGTPWAAENAKKLYDEVKAMVDEGRSTVPNEKLRLMWLGRGLWYNMGFYQHFEEKYGASFIWSQYLAIAATKYIREDAAKDPLRALATRFCSRSDVAKWQMHEAETHGIDGVVYLISNANCMNNGSFSAGTIMDFEKKGIPVLVLGADPADARTWNQDLMSAAVEEFLEKRVIPRKQRG